MRRAPNYAKGALCQGANHVVISDYFYNSMPQRLLFMLRCAKRRYVFAAVDLLRSLLILRANSACSGIQAVR